MKRITLYLIFTLSTFLSFSQIEKKGTINSESKKINQVSFRLFPTQNMWTFIKLDTRNGKMWQVQYGLKNEERFVTFLNLEPLVNKDKELNERFTLYPTQNIYNFILLDQIDGKTWQVQWSQTPGERALYPIE